MHNLLTVKETAKYLRIPLPTVYYLVQRGQLPAIQIGGRWRIKKNALDKDILKEEKSGQPTVLVVDDDESLQNRLKPRRRWHGQRGDRRAGETKIRSRLSRSQTSRWSRR